MNFKKQNNNFNISKFNNKLYFFGTDRFNNFLFTTYLNNLYRGPGTGNLLFNKTDDLNNILNYNLLLSEHNLLKSSLVGAWFGGGNSFITALSKDNYNYPLNCLARKELMYDYGNYLNKMNGIFRPLIKYDYDWDYLSCKTNFIIKKNNTLFLKYKTLINILFFFNIKNKTLKIKYIDEYFLKELIKYNIKKIYLLNTGDNLVLYNKYKDKIELIDYYVFDSIKTNFYIPFKFNEINNNSDILLGLFLNPILDERVSSYCYYNKIIYIPELILDSMDHLNNLNNSEGKLEYDKQIDKFFNNSFEDSIQNIIYKIINYSKTNNLDVYNTIKKLYNKNIYENNPIYNERFNEILDELLLNNCHP